MTYPPHYLLTWGGSFGSDPTEVWGNGIRLAPDDNLDGDVFQSASSGNVESQLDTYTSKITTLFQDTNSGYSTNTRLKYVKLNEIDTTGHYKSATETHARYLEGTLPTGGSQAKLPLHDSCAISFTTSAARGLACRGRIFLPHPAVGDLDGGGRITAARQQTLVDTWAAFMGDLDWDTDGGLSDGTNTMKPAIVSGVRGGAARTVMGVRVGNVVDHMESRRSKQVEVYINGAVSN